jgi:hypothetical protein
MDHKISQINNKQLNKNNETHIYFNKIDYSTCTNLMLCFSFVHSSILPKPSNFVYDYFLMHMNPWASIYVYKGNDFNGVMVCKWPINLGTCQWRNGTWLALAITTYSGLKS